MSKQDEIDDWVTNILKGCTTQESWKFQSQLLNVLGEIWEIIREKAISEIGMILFTDVPIIFKHGRRHLYTPAKEMKELCCPPREYVIAFPSWLLKESRNQICHTIAHEFAHVVLNHHGGADHEARLKREKAADALAAKWGFAHQD